MEVGVAHAAGGEGVDVRGRDLGAETAEVGEAEIVAEHDDHVGRSGPVVWPFRASRPGRCGRGEDPPDGAPEAGVRVSRIVSHDVRRSFEEYLGIKRSGRRARESLEAIGRESAGSDASGRRDRLDVLGRSSTPSAPPTRRRLSTSTPRITCSTCPTPVRAPDRRGPGEALAYVAAALEHVRFTLTITEVHPSADPDLVIAEYTSEGEMVATGQPYRNRYIGLWWFRDGHVCRTREFYNPAATTSLS